MIYEKVSKKVRDSEDDDPETFKDSTWDEFDQEDRLPRRSSRTIAKDQKLKPRKKKVKPAVPEPLPPSKDIWDIL